MIYFVVRLSPATAKVKGVLPPTEDNLSSSDTPPSTSAPADVSGTKSSLAGVRNIALQNRSVSSTIAHVAENAHTRTPMSTIGSSATASSYPNSPSGSAQQTSSSHLGSFDMIDRIDLATRGGLEQGALSPTARPPVITINDVPPAVIAQIASLVQSGKLADYLLEQGYSFPGQALPSSPNHGSGSSVDVSQQLGARSASPNESYNVAAAGRTHSIAETSLDDSARELLSSLTPNTAGNSGDPYNTTVFVGGLSALISEDTLRSFFVPFGDIHYVSFCAFCQSINP